MYVYTEYESSSFQRNWLSLFLDLMRTLKLKYFKTWDYFKHNEEKKSKTIKLSGFVLTDLERVKLLYVYWIY